MRIAVWHNLRSGGGKRALFDHVRGLLDRGHSIECWCPPTADLDYLPLSEIVPEHVIDLAWPAASLITDRFLITSPTVRALSSMEEHCRKCAREIDRGGFDVLFANSCIFFRTSPIGRFVNLPSTLYLQEPYRPLYEASPTLLWAARPAGSTSLLDLSSIRSALRDRKLIRNGRVQVREEVRNAAAFTRILANSYYSRESIKRAYGLDADVCYLGVDTDHFVDYGYTREKFVVSLGSFTPAKNAKLSIEAIAAMPEPRPRLVWIGNIVSQDYRTAMLEHATSLGVELDVRIFVAEDELLNLLNRASVMLYTPHLEPFGLAPLEANACGLPVVAVAEGGVRETIVEGENGLLVDGNPQALANAISRLMDDPPFAKKLGAAAREAVQTKWSLTAATERIEEKLLRYSVH